MQKNVTGQEVAFQMNSLTTGLAVTGGSPTVYYCVDAGGFETSGGTPVHKGQGQWVHTLASADECNGAHIAFTCVLSTAITQTVNVYTTGYDKTVTNLPANVTQILTDAQSAADLQDFADEGYDPTSNKITGCTLTDTVTALTTKTGFRLSSDGVDDILDEAITEPTTVFTWPSSLRSIIGWIGALSRNTVTQTNTTTTLKKDDQTSLATFAVSDDGTTFESTEAST